MGGGENFRRITKRTDDSCCEWHTHNTTHDEVKGQLEQHIQKRRRIRCYEIAAG
jgi:hypothetical protein